jgi:PhzF family phenazine biosynthesis protein
LAALAAATFLLTIGTSQHTGKVQVMVAIEVLRVFTDGQGGHGNPLGVVLDGTAVPDSEQRQKLAADLAFTETVFIDDIEHGRLQIFTPTVELPFAGHPTVGAAWLLARELGTPPTTVGHSRWPCGHLER